MNKKLVGVDLGGTFVRVAVADRANTHGPIVHHNIPELKTPEEVLSAVARAVAEACGTEKPNGLAIGIPGPLDPKTGMVYETPNLPWKNVPAGELLAEKVGCPVVIANDADMAGYAEWKFGAGKGTKHFIFITVSTGIGGGIIVNGELLNGVAGTAGELGHVAVAESGPRCGSGHPGCLEAMASGTAIANRARDALDQGVASTLAKLNRVELSAVDVDVAARAGDKLANELYSHAGHALGRAIGGLINVFSPEVIVIGGGLINAEELLFDPLHKAVDELAFQIPLQACRIERAALGTDAGIVGVVAWSVKNFE